MCRRLILLVGLLAIIVSGGEDPIKLLNSPRKLERYKGHDQYRKAYGLAAMQLTREAQRLLPKGDRSVQGTLHLVLKLLREYHVRETAAALTPYITFTLDPKTATPGRYVSGADYYPVAQTLSFIGGEGVVQTCLVRIETSRSNKERLLCTWIYQRVVGEDTALAAMKTIAAKKPKSQNLTDAVALLSKGPLMLDTPKSK